jgi:hypothetical protein
VFPERSVVPERREQDRQPGTESGGYSNLSNGSVPGVPGVPGAPASKGDGGAATTDAWDEGRQRAYDLAERLTFQEVGTTSVAAGPGAALWRAWLLRATDGQVRTMTLVLDAMLAAREVPAGGSAS